MVFALRVSGFDDEVERDEIHDRVSRESGTRRVAPRSHGAPEGPDEETPLPRESQRPTVPVPGAASLVAYLACPPHIQQIAVDAGRLPRVAIHMQAVADPAVHAKPTVIPAQGMHHEDAELGSLDRVPVVTATMSKILLAELDHREGFLLSLVDGRSSIEALLDAAPMPAEEALAILEGLRASGLITIRDAASDG